MRTAMHKLIARYAIKTWQKDAQGLYHIDWNTVGKYSLTLTDSAPSAYQGCIFAKRLLDKTFRFVIHDNWQDAMSPEARQYYNDSYKRYLEKPGVKEERLRYNKEYYKNRR